MKIKYKYIEFVKRETAKEIFWNINNHKYEQYLGNLQYNPKWKQWEFCPEPDTGFTQDCLEYIIHFIKQLIGEEAH